MPASRSNKELCSLSIEFVLLSLLIAEFQFLLVKLNKSWLSTDLIHPGWSKSIFKISHEHISTTIHCVDAHFGIRWSSNLNPSALDILRRRRNFPVTFSDVLSFLREGKRCTTLDEQGLFLSLEKKCFSSRIELSLESSKEFETLRCEKFSSVFVLLDNSDSWYDLIWARHFWWNYVCVCILMCEMCYFKSVEIC